MLIELNVKDFGLMEEVHLELGQGFSVFTGETGAGKSMLVDALGLLLGGRASSESIRHGKEKTSVEGVFVNLPSQILTYLEEEGYPLEDDMLFLYREVNSSGRNMCRVQGRTVPLSLYRTFCKGLVDIHGQMEHQSLLNAEYHRELLDSFGGAEHLALLTQVKESAAFYRQIAARERGLLQTESSRLQQEEFLRFQLDEIEKVAPAIGEEEQLTQEKTILQNEERILRLVNEAYASMYDSSERGGGAALEQLGRAVKAVMELSAIDPDTAEISEALNNLYYSLDDLARQVRSYKMGLEFEPGRLDEIEDRLAALGRLRKFGATTEEVLRKREEMQLELEDINSIQEEKEAVKIAKKDALSHYNALAEELSLKRGIQADRLEKGLAREFKELGLENARVEVIFAPVTEPAAEGSERIEFYFSANVGEPSRPLGKVASGGEAARIMLAFKSLFSQIELVDTFIFDEVDSGVGGLTIKKVAEKLERIAKSRQVLCITHNALIAAAAPAHYALSKEVAEERTVTRVVKLSEKERITELARMMGGDDLADHMAERLRKQTF